MQITEFLEITGFEMSKQDFELFKNMCILENKRELLDQVTVVETETKIQGNEEQESLLREVDNDILQLSLSETDMGDFQVEAVKAWVELRGEGRLAVEEKVAIVKKAQMDTKRETLQESVISEQHELI